MADTLYWIEGGNPSAASFSFTPSDRNTWRWNSYATLKFYQTSTMVKSATLFLFVGTTSTYSESSHKWNFSVSLYISRGTTKAIASSDEIMYKLNTGSWTSLKINSIPDSSVGQTTLWTSSTSSRGGSESWSGYVDCSFKDSSGSTKTIRCSYTASTKKNLFTINYYTNGGNETYPSTSVYYGEECPNPGSPTRNTDFKDIKCTFNGNGSTEPATADTKQISRQWTFREWDDLSDVYSDRDVYAEWDGKWTPVQFDLKGGFTRTGFTFNYWANGSGGNEGQAEGKSANSYTSDTTFYAQWTPVDVNFIASFAYKDLRDGRIKSIGLPDKSFNLKYDGNVTMVPEDVPGYYGVSSSNKPIVYSDNTFTNIYSTDYNVKGTDCLNTDLHLYVVYNAIPYKVNFSYPAGFIFNGTNPYIFYVFDEKFSLQKFQVITGDDNINFARWKDSTEKTVDEIDPSIASDRKDYSVFAEFINADIWVKRYGKWNAVVNQWVKSGDKWRGTSADKTTQLHYTDDTWFYVKKDGKWVIQESKKV